MRLTAALVFAAVTVLTGSAHAVPLRITEGEIWSIGVMSDLFFAFAGPGFSVGASCRYEDPRRHPMAA
jgi:hypothetical protein